MHNDSDAAGRLSGRGTFVIIFLGIIYPVAALAVESLWHICGSFFDPIASPWHFIAIALVPFVHLMILIVRGEKWLALRRFACGLIMPIELIYCVPFAPLMIMLLPLSAVCFFSFIAIPGAILASLAYSPLFAFIATVVAHCSLAGPGRSQKLFSLARLKDASFFSGFALSFTFLFLVNGPICATRIGMEMANEQDFGRAREGIALLRSFGSEAEMRKYCNDDVQLSRFDSLSFVRPNVWIGKSDARRIYYRVTGKSINEVPASQNIALKLPFDWGRFGPRNTFDIDRASKEVGQFVPELRLENSVLSSKVDPKAAACRYTWQMQLASSSNIDHEGRMFLKLPEGSAVSSAYLWIGEKKTLATVTSKNRARNAYKQVVQVQRRDPLLVTTAGRDRVLVQLFPINEKNPRRFELVIDAPMSLRDPNKALCALPYITEANFNLEARTIVSAPVSGTCAEDSKLVPLTLLNPLPTSVESGKVGESKEGLVLAVVRDPAIKSVSAFDITRTRSDGEKAIVRATFEKATRVKPAHLTVLIDGSLSVQPYLKEIAAALKHLPDGVPCRVVFVSDEIKELCRTEAGFSPEVVSRLADNAAGALGRMTMVGGQNNILPLQVIISEALKQKNEAGQDILWIHGKEPVLLSDPEPLKASLALAGAPLVYEMQVGPGSSRLVESLDQTPNMVTVTRCGSIQEDLSYFLDSLKPGEAHDINFTDYQRTIFKDGAPIILPGDMPDLLPNLYAARASRYAAMSPAARRSLTQGSCSSSKKDIADNEKATYLGASYGLVTPFTGAIVLEKEEDYKRANIKRGDAQANSKFVDEDVSATPEPHEILLCMVLLAVAYLMRPARPKLHGQKVAQ